MIFTLWKSFYIQKKNIKLSETVYTLPFSPTKIVRYKLCVWNEQASETETRIQTSK